MADNVKTGIPNEPITRTHPFKIFIGKGAPKNGKSTLTLAINYHSFLYAGMSKRDKYLKYKRIDIKKFSKDGIDFATPVPDGPNGFPAKNINCVLDLTISSLAVTDAKIKYVPGDLNQDDLDPIVFNNAEEFSQVGARVILGVLASDDEAVPGLKASEIKTPYLIQYVHTHLMMTNMVFDGIPVVYPVPFVGGRLNDEFPQEESSGS